jgi:hypothetical protein
MSRKTVMAVVAAAALAAGAAGYAASTQVPGDGKNLSGYFFGSRMARAEIVMVLPGGQIADYRVDQGRVRGLKGATLVLVERDQTRVEVPVAPDARIIVEGAPATLSDILPGMSAITVREGANAASLVRAGRRLLR